MKENRSNDNELQARRRLLKAAVYVPPVVLGVLTVGASPAQALVIGGISYPVSTNATACAPCTNAINGTGSVNQLQKNALNCMKAQCLNGTCTNCDWFVNNAALWGKTAAAKCEKVLQAGCAATPANLPAGCAGVVCTKKGNKWKCK